MMSCANHNHDGGCEYCITSITTLLDQEGCSLKAYGWSKTDTTITLILNQRDERSPAHFLTFNCPKFETKEVKNNSNGRILRRNYNYECDRAFVGAYMLTRFIPICLRVHDNRFNSFFLLVLI